MDIDVNLIIGSGVTVGKEDLNQEKPKTVTQDTFSIEMEGGYLCLVKSLEETTSPEVGLENLNQMVAGPQQGQGQLPPPQTISVMPDGTLCAHVVGACANTIPYLIHLLLHASAQDKILIELMDPEINDNILVSLAGAMELCQGEVKVNASYINNIFQFMVVDCASVVDIQSGLTVLREIQDYAYGDVGDVQVRASATRLYSDYIYDMLIARGIITAEQREAIKINGTFITVHSKVLAEKLKS